MFSPAAREIGTLADARASRGLRIVDEPGLNGHNEPGRRGVAAMLEWHGAAGADSRKHRLLRQLARVHVPCPARPSLVACGKRSAAAPSAAACTGQRCASSP